MEFHPKQPILASGSRDCTVKLFDYSKVSAKKASRTICDASHVETISFHPDGMKILSTNQSFLGYKLSGYQVLSDLYLNFFRVSIL